MTELPSVRLNAWRPLCLLAALSFGASQNVGGSLTPPGPPGPTFKTLTDIEPREILRPKPQVVAPLVIDQPGSYFLTEDVVAIPDQPAIRITVSPVTLDQNG
jgi:hypothetical protein